MTSRLEPENFNPTDIHEKCMEIFEKKQWVTFFEKFDGHNENVSLAFAESFDEIQGVSPLFPCRFYTLAHDHGVHDFFINFFHKK